MGLNSIENHTFELRPHLSGPNMIEYGVLSFNCFCKARDITRQSHECHMTHEVRGVHQ